MVPISVVSVRDPQYFSEDKTRIRCLACFNHVKDEHHDRDTPVGVLIEALKQEQINELQITRVPIASGRCCRRYADMKVSIV